MGDEVAEGFVHAFDEGSEGEGSWVEVFSFIVFGEALIDLERGVKGVVGAVKEEGFAAF